MWRNKDEKSHKIKIKLKTDNKFIIPNIYKKKHDYFIIINATVLTDLIPKFKKIRR